MSAAASASTMSAAASASAAVEHIRAAGLVKNRRWRLRKYMNVFVGSEAVASLVSSGKALTREVAVDQLRHALEQNLIAHTVREHHFRDKFLFYRIVTDGGNPQSSMANLKEGAKKHGSAAIRVGKFTNEGRYIILASDNVLHEFATAHAPFPLRSLPLDQRASGAVSFCGKLKTGRFGITVHPPLCEMDGVRERDDSVGSSVHTSAGGESKQLDLGNEARIVLLFDDIRDQESWLHNLVKGGLDFKELAFETNNLSTATTIYDFSVDVPKESSPINLRDLAGGRVVIVVNVASF